MNICVDGEDDDEINANDIDFDRRPRGMDKFGASCLAVAAAARSPP